MVSVKQCLDRVRLTVHTTTAGASANQDSGWCEYNTQAWPAYMGPSIVTKQLACLLSWCSMQCWGTTLVQSCKHTSCLYRLLVDRLAIRLRCCLQVLGKLNAGMCWC